jgi:hypothetical protein
MRHAFFVAAALCLALASASAAPLLAAQGGFRTSIGSRHASISLDGSWRRSSFVGDGGKDQFDRIGKSQYFFVIEGDGLVPSRRSGKGTADLLFEKISSTDRNAVRTVLDGWSDSGAIVERWRIDMKLNGVSMSYLVYCSSCYGSTYTFVSWTLRQGFAAFSTDMDGIVRSLDARLTNERYAKWLSMRSLYAWLDDAELRLDYPSRILAPDPTEDPLVSLGDPAGDARIELIADGAAGAEPRQARSKRGVLRVAQLGALAYECAEADEDVPGTLSLRIPPNVAGRSLTLRISADLEEESLKALASWLLGSLESKRGPSVLPYPRAVRAEVAGAEDAVRKLLAASRLEAALAGSFKGGGRSGSELWIATSKGLWRAGAGKPKADLGPDGVSWSDRYVDVRGTLYRSSKESGGPEKVGESGGDPLAAAELYGVPMGYIEGFGVVSVEERPREGALASLWKPERPSALLRFGAMKSTREAPFAVSADSPRGAAGPAGLLLVEDSGDEGVDARLAALTSPKGEWRSLGVWRYVSFVAATDNGWLVRGKPAEGRAGTWLLRPSGPGTLIVGDGELQPFAVLDGRLWYASRLKDERGSQGGWDEAWVRSVDLKTAAALGSAVGLVDADMLNSCGTAIASLPLTAARDVTEARRVLEGKAAALGATLPRAASDVDLLVDRVRADDALEADGFAALLVILSASLMDHGAEWVESPCPRASSIPTASRWFGSDLSSRAYQISGILASALYDDEGWYSPAAEAGPDDKDGRRVLVGLSAARLRSRSAEFGVGDLGERLRSPAGDIASWLLLPRNASNLRLREEAYERLFELSDRKRLTPLLESMAARGPTSLESYYGLLLDMEGTTVPSRDERVSRLCRILETRQDDPLAYYLLGQAWEEGQPERGAESARALACYRKALSLSSYGSRRAALKARIEEAIRRIERSMAPDAVIEEGEA